MSRDEAIQRNLSTLSQLDRVKDERDKLARRVRSVDQNGNYSDASDTQCNLADCQFCTETSTSPHGVGGRLNVWYGGLFGMVYHMVCMVWCGVVWCGVVWCGVVWYGMVWYGMVWYGMVWYGMVWYGMVWYGMVWYGMVWYGMVWQCRSKLDNWGAHIHIFLFCVINLFWNRLFLWSVNTKIWIWAPPPPIIELATALYGMVWYGMVGMVWYGMVWYVIYEQRERVFHRDIQTRENYVWKHEREARVFSYIVFECLDIPVRHELELFIWLLKWIET